MLTESIHGSIAGALEKCGYQVEAFDAKNSDVLDIWSRDESQGFIEVTVCHAEPGYVVLCPVDYDSDEGLIEIFGSDVTPLADQLNRFYGVQP